MRLNDYFDPVNNLTSLIHPEDELFGNHTDINRKEKEFPSLKERSIVLIGVGEFRPARLSNGHLGADQVRHNLYNLALPVNDMKVTDLGNLKLGKSENDSRIALRDTVASLLKENHIPVVIGGPAQMNYDLWKASETLALSTNITAIDSRTGFCGDYLSAITKNNPELLFNCTNIGYQSHFAGQPKNQTEESYWGDFHRLGTVREDIKEMEPLLRDTDLLMINMSSIRQSDSPASITPTPNGLFGEEVCQLARYAGNSDRVRCLGVCDWHVDFDTREQTARLVAQIIWYFIQGYYTRKNEFPFNPHKNATGYIVNISGGKNSSIEFYRSNISGLWWMEVPWYDKNISIPIPCSGKDYDKTCQGEIPDRWWYYYRKLNG